MSAVSDLLLRTLSTLIATMATAVLITERQRRILNAKVEMAAQHVEMLARVDCEAAAPKEIVRDLELAEEMIRDAVWSRVARVSKLQDVVHISRTLRHIRHKHERLREGANPAETTAIVAAELKEGRFNALAARIRTLKVSFIDFVFVRRGASPAPTPPHGSDR